ALSPFPFARLPLRALLLLSELFDPLLRVLPPNNARARTHTSVTPRAAVPRLHTSHPTSLPRRVPTSLLNAPPSRALRLHLARDAACSTCSTPSHLACVSLPLL